MIYADYNGSAPLLPEVRTYLHKRLDSNLYANPSAIHSMGQRVSKGIEKCREIIASTVGCYPDQIFFNSGSSEGISHVIHSILDQASIDKKIIISSPIEHVVIPSALEYYENHRGFKVVYVDIDSDGVVQTKSLEKLINEYKDKIAMVTVMAANNETGVIQPYQEIARICKSQQIEYFCDTTQLIGKGEFYFESSGLDYAVCSGHKIGALSGTGFMIAKEPPRMQPLIFGSSQEKGLRGGTQHYIGIETLAISLNDFKENSHRLTKLKEAKLLFEKQVTQSYPTSVIVGGNADRLAGTTLIGLPGIHGQAVQIELESQDIFVTTSAACSDNQPETSKVLKAMAVDDQVGRGVIRISLSYSQGDKEYSAIADALKSAYAKLIKIKSF